MINELLTNEDLIKEIQELKNENEILKNINTILENENNILENNLNEYKDAYTKLRGKTNHKTKIKNYYKIQSVIFKTGLSALGVIIMFGTLIEMGIERLDYNYDGWFNTNCIILYAIGMSLMILPFIVNIISYLYNR